MLLILTSCFNFFVVAAILKRPLTPPANNPVVDYPSAGSEQVSKRARQIGISDEVHCIPFTCPTFTPIFLEL